MRIKLTIIAALVTGALAIPALPAAAATAYEVRYVPSVGGAVIRVEIQRDTKFDAVKQPVILTYSPYNNLNEAGDFKTANDGIATRYNPKGYARAVADVLGTRGSTGCWDYGGAKETQSGVDVVQFLAGKKADVNGNLIDWSNGNIGMTGTSYDGTTANMVAATGEPALKGIIPIAAISRWYGYAFENGARYFLNSRVPTDEGFDTPLAFDFGFGKTVPLNPQDPGFAAAAQARAAECGSVEHTQQGYSRNPDYGKFWQERDYLEPARNGAYRAAVMVVHGWQDYNVKQEEGTDLYEALKVDDPATAEVEGAAFKKLWMTQAAHSGGSGPGYVDAVDRFWARTLLGESNGIENEKPVTTLGRNAAGITTWQAEAQWPPPTTRDLKLYLGRKFDKVPGVPSLGPVGTTGEYGWLSLDHQNTGGGWAHVSPGTISEEVTLKDPLNREIRNVNGQPVRGHGYYSLFQESAPLAQDVRIAGSALLDTWVNATTPSMHVTPLLVEVKPDGSLVLVERGFLNLDYRNGLAKAESAMGWQHARVEFLPQDYTFTKGSRIGLMLQGSNTVWALPGSPGLISYAMGPVDQVTGESASLSLPVVDLTDPRKVFGENPGQSAVYRAGR